MSGNPLRHVEENALYAQLGRIIETMPLINQKLIPPHNLVYAPVPSDQMMWLARAETLVGEALGIVGAGEFRRAMADFDMARPSVINKIKLLLYRALAQVEVELPSPPTNSFIPAGNAFDALQGLQRIFALATKDMLVVDPYLDEKFLFEFAAFAPAGITLRLLTTRPNKRPALAPALKSWRIQHSAERPIAVRSAPGASLHDRSVLIDNARVWMIGQSFNAMATRAPTSFVEADVETAKLKVEAYNEIWHGADELEAD
jgi:hypothetical protein